NDPRGGSLQIGVDGDVLRRRRDGLGLWRRGGEILAPSRPALPYRAAFVGGDPEYPGNGVATGIEFRGAREDLHERGLGRVLRGGGIGQRALGEPAQDGPQRREDGVERRPVAVGERA